MLKRRIIATLSPLFTIVPDLFAFTLLFYLLLFLLENLFHGFVSNNFDLNIFLIPVIFLGGLSAFAPARIEEEKKVGKSDFILAAGISFLALLTLLYKTWGMAGQGILISFASALFIAFVSFVMIVLPDKKTEDLEFNKMEISSKTVFPVFSAIYFRIGAAALVILVIAGAVLFVTRNGKQPESGKQTTIVNPAPQEEKNKEISIPSAGKLKDNPVVILKGGIQEASVSAVIQTLKKKEFVVQKISNADNTSYKNAVVEFLPDQVEVAEYLVYVLKNIYPLIERAPLAPGKKDIILILGKQE